MVAPGPGFYVRGKHAQEGQGMNQIRLAYVLEVPKIERAMKALQHAVEVYKTK